MCALRTCHLSPTTTDGQSPSPALDIWLLCSQPPSHLQFWNAALLTYFVLPFRWNSKYREACPNLLKFLASSLQWDETTPCHRLLKINYNILFFILRILPMLNDFHDDHNIFSAATIFRAFNVHRLQNWYAWFDLVLLIHQIQLMNIRNDSFGNKSFYMFYLPSASVVWCSIYSS